MDKKIRKTAAKQNSTFQRFQEVDSGLSCDSRCHDASAIPLSFSRRSVEHFILENVNASSYTRATPPVAAGGSSVSARNDAMKAQLLCVLGRFPNTLSSLKRRWYCKGVELW